MTKIIACTRVLSEALKENTNQNEFHFLDKDFINIEILDKVNLKDIEQISKQVAVFTSANGVRGFVQLLKENNIEAFDNHCYCIEGKTSKTALEYGFKIIKTEYSGEKIANEIVKNKEKRVVHYTSNLRRKELNNILKKKSIAIETVEVYSKKITPHKLNNLDAIMFFSPSQIDSFYSQNDFDTEKPAFCIGTTTAKHLEGKGHKKTIISEIPSEKNILETAIKYFNK